MTGCYAAVADFTQDFTRTIHGKRGVVHGPNYGILTKMSLWDVRHSLQLRQKLLATVLYKTLVIRVTIIVWQTRVAQDREKRRLGFPI